MAIDLITGHQGQAHISAEQIADLHNIMMANGSNNVVRLQGGAVTLANDAFNIATGYWRVNGYDIEIQEAESHSMDLATSGYTRIDCLYIEFLQNIPTGYQRVEFVIVTGEESSSTPTEPNAPASPTLNTDILLQCFKVASCTVTSSAATSLVDNSIPLSLESVEVPYYATSSTAQSTAAKVATTTQSGFSLVTGAKVIVKFTYTNTASAPTLNINSTGAKSIKGYGSTVPSLWWLAGDVVEFTYDGTNWLMQPTQGQITTLNSNLTEVQDIFESNAGAHNCIYRGKSLGTSVTASQYSAISDGTFDDMYIGDYWTINNVVYRIASFDYWLKTGDTQCTTHHVVIVPDTNLGVKNMNSTNTTSGGYVGSEMYTTNMATAKSTIETAFGSAHILSHREYLTNAITNGYASAGAWYDSEIELMNEIMVYGCSFFTPHNSLGATIPNTHTADNSQLPLFRHDHSRITNREGWWLRDVVSVSEFADIGGSGNCNYAGASYSLGVRPAFGIMG